MFTALRPRIPMLRSNGLAAARPLHISARLRAGVNPQDKDAINAEPTEYSKTGSDAQAAHKDGAFDGSKTRPEDHKDGGGEPSGSLNASPANHNLGKPPAGKQDTSKSSPSEDSSSTSSRQETSGGGSPKKGGASPAGGQGGSIDQSNKPQQ